MSETDHPSESAVRSAIVDLAIILAESRYKLGTRDSYERTAALLQLITPGERSTQDVRVEAVLDEVLSREAEAEASAILDRVCRELTEVEHRTDRLMQHYSL